MKEVVIGIDKVIILMKAMMDFFVDLVVKEVHFDLQNFHIVAVNEQIVKVLIIVAKRIVMIIGNLIDVLVLFSVIVTKVEIV